MIEQTKLITADEFDKFVELPENADTLFELIGGEIVEVPSNTFSSQIAARILGFFFIYLLQRPIAHITGEGGGYMVSGERYAPDVALLLIERQAELAKRGYNPLAPDLAVEVISPTDRPRNIQIKVGNYLAAGTLLWLVYPDLKSIDVYAPVQPVKSFGINDTLDAGGILPDFRLAVKDIFAVVSE